MKPNGSYQIDKFPCLGLIVTVVVSLGNRTRDLQILKPRDGEPYIPTSKVLRGIYRLLSTAVLMDLKRARRRKGHWRRALYRL